MKSLVNNIFMVIMVSFVFFMVITHIVINKQEQSTDLVFIMNNTEIEKNKNSSEFKTSVSSFVSTVCINSTNILTFLMFLIAWRTYYFIKTQWRQDNLHKLREQLKEEQKIYNDQINDIDLKIHNELDSEDFKEIAVQYDAILNRWLNELDFLAMYILEGSIQNSHSRKMFYGIYCELISDQVVGTYITDTNKNNKYTFTHLVKLITKWKLLGENPNA